MAISACVSNYKNILIPPAGSDTEIAMGGAGINQYVVPAYQRPYQWKQQPFSQFVGERGLADHLITNGAGVSFFAGHVVFYRDPASNIAEVVDGQQRFTSLSIITAALRDECFRNSQYELAWDIHENFIFANNNFLFQSSSYNSDDEEKMRILQEIPSDIYRAAPNQNVGRYRSEPLNLDFQVTLLDDIHPGVASMPRIKSSTNAFNFAVPVGTQLDFGGILATFVHDKNPEDTGGVIQISLQSANHIPAGSTAEVSLTNAGISTDSSYDDGLANPHLQLDRRKKWWRYYKIAVEEIRATINMGITHLQWYNLLSNNLILTLARSDLTREAQNYFKVINDDRFRQPLTLADVWRAEVISAITTDAMTAIEQIEGNPNPDPFGIDGGFGVGFMNGMGGSVYQLSEEIRNRLHTDSKRDEYVFVNDFIEHFCISFGKRTSGTSTLQELEDFRKYLREQIIAGRPGGGLTSGIPGVALPESADNASVRLDYLAYEEFMRQAELRSKVYREIVKPRNEDTYGTRLKNLHRTSHKQYIPFLLAGFSKIRSSAQSAGVVRPGPGAAGALVAAWAPYQTAENRLVRMIEYLIVRGSILPSPNDGAITPNVIYSQIVKWCAAIDQCPNTIADIDLTLRQISGSVASPAFAGRPAVVGGAPGIPPIAAGGPAPVRENFAYCRKFKWERDQAGGPANPNIITFQTIYGLCDGRTWENPAAAGTIDPKFWNDSDYIYPSGAESRLLLWLIENYLRQNIVGAVAAGNLDITLTNDSDVEHILPKRLNAYWNGVLGVSDQIDWLDRLGNKGLMRSESNNAISNFDFPTKQNMPVHGYNNTANLYFHMQDLTNPKIASPLLTPGDPSEVPHNNLVPPPGLGIYGPNWTTANIETRGKWLFDIIWNIFNPLP